jgi:putative ABC transport system permease protein
VELTHVSRIIRRDALSLVTNMTGLSLGLAASILLAVFVQFELTFDRHFSRGQRIFRLNSIWIADGDPREMPINLRQAYSEIPAKVAGIEAAIQLYRGFKREITVGEDRHQGLDLIYSDPGFFQLFDLESVSGSTEDALSAPGAVVLTERTARRVFGSTDVVGESLVMEGRIFTVSAVVANIPPNTHFSFDLLMPMESILDLRSFGGLEFFTYYLLQEGVDRALVLEAIAGENTRMLSEGFARFGGATFGSRLEPLRDLHLHSQVQWDLSQPGSMRTIYIMLFVALAVMGLALTNFINLYILSGARRSREIGIRKVSGAGRKELIRQFYLEALVVVSCSFAAGTVLAVLLLPAFADVMQRDSFAGVTSTPGLYLVLAGVYLATVLLSGFYPALLLSRAAPASLIRGTVNPAGDKRILLRGVNVFQVCTATCLLVVLLGINTQIRFLQNRSPGYDPHNIVQIRNLNEGLTQNYAALKDRLLSHASTEAVGASTHSIGGGTSGQGVRLAGEPPERDRSINEYRVRPGLCSIFRFRLLAGRFLDPQREADNAGVILNEAAVEMLGYTPQEIVGESILMHGNPLAVTGVVQDFNYQSAAQTIGPMVITAYSDAIRNIAIRYAAGTEPGEILRVIYETVRDIDPAYIMLQDFSTDIVRDYYQGEERLQKILLSGSFLAVVIVLLGIYALVSHNLAARTKELGIRKVLGGATADMIALICIPTLKWTLIAAVLAVPPAMLYLRSWLSDYAVRTPLHWWIFGCAIAGVVLSQSLVTMVRTHRSARRNPVDDLRCE